MLSQKLEKPKIMFEIVSTYVTLNWILHIRQSYCHFHITCCLKQKEYEIASNKSMHRFCSGQYIKPVLETKELYCRFSLTNFFRYWNKAVRCVRAICLGSIYLITILINTVADRALTLDLFKTTIFFASWNKTARSTVLQSPLFLILTFCQSVTYIKRNKNEDLLLFMKLVIIN